MIELLHSYQYLSNNKTKLFIKDREMVVDSNNNFLFGLSNIPKNKKIYNIRVNKINTKKSSLKLNRKVNKFNIFSNNANVKILIDVNKSEFNNSINKGIIPSEDELVKLLKRSIKKNIKYDEYLSNLIKDVHIFHEYSWYLERESNKENIIYQPCNIYKIYDKYIDLDKRKIYNCASKCSKNLSLCGGIVLNNVNNNLTNIIKLIYKTSFEKTLIITNNTKIWEKNLTPDTYNIVNTKVFANKNIHILPLLFLTQKSQEITNKLLNIKFDRIIYFNCIDKKISIEKLKSFRSLKKWYITDKSFILKFDDLCNIYKLMFSYDLTYYDNELIKKTIESISEYKKLTKPISPENSIGRVSRMDAINNKSVIEAALRNMEEKLLKLKFVKSKIDNDDFGICTSCKNEIPLGRILIVPESRFCVKCA